VKTLISTCSKFTANYPGDLLNSLMYFSEDGQIRSRQELKQTVELFSYDVGLFDFDLGVLNEKGQKDKKRAHLPYLSAFVQRTAALKLASVLGVFSNVKKSGKGYFSDSEFSEDTDSVRFDVYYKSVFEFYTKEFFRMEYLKRSGIDVKESTEYKVAKIICQSYNLSVLK